MIKFFYILEGQPPREIFDLHDSDTPRFYRCFDKDGAKLHIHKTDIEVWIEIAEGKLLKIPLAFAL